MNPTLESVKRRLHRLECELFVWRVLLIIIAVGAMLGAAPPQSEKEIRLTSADGKDTVVLSAEGLSLQSGGQSVVQLRFQTVGDGDQYAFFKLVGDMNVDLGDIRVASSDQHGASIRPEGFALFDGHYRTDIHPGELTLSDREGKALANLSADNGGLTGLSLVYEGKVIAQLGSAGRFVTTNPPKRDAANLSLTDWSPDFKQRVITPSGDTTHEKSKAGTN